MNILTRVQKEGFNTLPFKPYFFNFVFTPDAGTMNLGVKLSNQPAMAVGRYKLSCNLSYDPSSATGVSTTLTPEIMLLTSLNGYHSMIWKTAVRALHNPAGATYGNREEFTIEVEFTVLEPGLSVAFKYFPPYMNCTGGVIERIA